jgi:hypothetical protein
MRVFPLGTLAKWITWLHYRYEVRPYAKKKGHDRAEVRAVVATAVQRIFDDAWRDTP